MRTKLRQWAILAALCVNMAACDIGCGCGEECANEGTGPSPAVDPLVITCTASPRSGRAPLTVTFDSTVSGGVPGVSTRVTWNFGDGSSSATGSATHVYTTSGIFSATVSAIQGDLRASCSHTILTNVDSWRQGG
jgi:PKD repeat protein